MTAIKIGIIADIHVGSAFGPIPLKFVSSNGNLIQPNIGQKYLLRNWLRIADEIPNLDVLILNGDIIDGQQPKAQGRYICEPDPQFQARAALELLQPYLAKSQIIYCTEGTEYHEGESATWAEWLAREIKAEAYQHGHYAWDWLLLEIGGLQFDIAHRQSFFLRYRATALEREMQFSAMLESTADVIVRSHTHQYAVLQMPCDGGIQFGISTPGWQLQSHYARTSYSPNRLYPLRLGIIAIIIENDRVRVDDYTFAHPPPRRAKVEKKR